MKLPICDLMDACCPEALIAPKPDAAMTERIQNMVREKKKTRHGKLPLGILVAAIVTLFTIGTVFAVVFSRMELEDVSEQEVGQYVPNRYGTISYMKWEGATQGFRFEIESDEFYEVYVRPGWLPTPVSTFFSTADQDGWTTYETSTEEAFGTPFQMQVYWGHRLKDKMYFLSGDVEIVKEDTWNNLKRVEAVVHEKPDSFDGTKRADTNYILLFSEMDHYLIRICGYSDFETLERIADEMEIRVTNTLILEEPSASNGLFMSQPLDMEGNRIQEWLKQSVEAAKERGEVEYWKWQEMTATIDPSAPQYAFDVTQPCYEVQIRANWLPHGSVTGDQDADGFGTMLQSTDHNDYFSAIVYQGDWLYNRTVWFYAVYGVEVVKEDICNGLQRIELSSDLSDTNDENHVLLYSEAGNCLIYLYNRGSMETLEIIAENLEIQITDTMIEIPEREPISEQLSGGGFAKG